MEVEELCRKLRPILGKKADAIYRAYLTEDYQGKRELMANLEIIYARTLSKDLTEDKILLIPPAKEKTLGEYPVGRIVYNEKELYGFALKESELLQHCVILGRSGSGKTNTAFALILGLLCREKPFLILDWKRNYRDLLSVLPEEKKKDVLIFTVGRDISPFKFNPLVPPQGTPPEVWLKKLIEIIAHAFYCGDGVMYLLQNAIDAVYREFGVYENKQKQWPVMQDVLVWLKKYNARGREAGWMSSTLRAVQSLCFGEMGRVLDIRSQTGLEELLKKNVIMELDTLTNNDKIFLIESLLLWIHHYRMAEGKRETLKHVILVEEAHHILLKQKQDLQGGETVVDIIVREIRELGEGLILIDQVPSQMSNVALANTYTTIAMNLKHQSDVYSAARSMLLGVGEKDYLGKLEVGFAICKLQGRIFKPFLLKIPLIKLKKGTITDEKVKEEMKIYHKFTGNREIIEKQGFSGSLPENKSGNANPELIRVISDEDKLSVNEKIILIDILKNPAVSILNRYERLGFNSYLGNAIKQALTNKDLIIIESVPTSNARVKIMKLTNYGKSILRKLGHKVKPENNGSEHKYWKYKIADYYKNKDHSVEIEKDGADILVDKKMPIEIATGKSDEMKNIKRNLERYNQSLTVVVNKQVKKKLIEELREANLLEDKRVRIADVRGYN